MLLFLDIILHYYLFITILLMNVIFVEKKKIAIRGDGKSPDQTTISKFSVFQSISWIV